MKPHSTHSAKALLSDNRGVTAIEFAFIAPVLFIFMMGTVEMFVVMLAQNVMENATFNASRAGKTGFVDVSITREETIRKSLDQYAGALLDTNLITISSKTYAEFDEIGQPEPFIDANSNGTRDNGENYTDVNGNGVYDMDMGAASPGSASEVVVYQVDYPWTIYTPVVQQMFGDNGTVTLSARTVVRNEPF